MTTKDTRTMYHFTSEVHLPRIMESGRLRLSDANLDMFQAHFGVDVVWLLDTPTVDHDHGLLAGGFAAVDKTRVRFTVEVPERWVKQWIGWKAVERMDPEWRATLIQAGGGHDAAAHWWVSMREIPHTMWTEVRDMREDKVIGFG